MRLLLLFTLCIPFITSAQITIDDNDMPSSGDTIRYTNGDVQGFAFDPLLTGASYSWDFSNITGNTTSLFEYKNSFSTPYAFYFFNKMGLKVSDSVGFAQFQLTDLYSFYSKSSSVFKVEGQGYTYTGIPLANNYVDEDEIYQFPLQYGDYDSSTFYFDFNLSQITSFLNYAQNGYRINDVDGWGTVITPYQTYSNVLRVKSTIHSYDSIMVSGFPVVNERTMVEYKWLSKTEKIPVLEISGALNGTTFTPSIIRYRGTPPPDTSSSSINDLKNNLAVNVYPNPFNNELFIQSEQQKLSYAIVNSAGIEVLNGKVLNTQSINTETLDKGLYLMTLSTGLQSKTIKLIK